MNRDALREQIKAHEGYREEPYRDSLGWWTVGYGHNIHHDSASMTMKVGDLLDYYADKGRHARWLETDIDAAMNIALNWFGPQFSTQTDARQRILVEMAFVLGNRVSRFVRFHRFAIAGQHGPAAAELIDSLWHRQATNRVNALSEQWAEG